MRRSGSTVISQSALRRKMSAIPKYPFYSAQSRLVIRAGCSGREAVSNRRGERSDPPTGTAIAQRRRFVVGVRRERAAHPLELRTNLAPACCADRKLLVLSLHLSRKRGEKSRGERGFSKVRGLPTTWTWLFGACKRRALGFWRRRAASDMAACSSNLWRLRR
jgi:hypothetical protein